MWRVFVLVFRVCLLGIPRRRVGTWDDLRADGLTNVAIGPPGDAEFVRSNRQRPRDINFLYHDPKV
jgi:hypothetical protein